MQKFFLEFLFSIVKRVPVPSELMAGLAIILASTWYILDPMGNPYINVPGNRLVFELPQFENCVVSFRKPLAITHYVIERPDQPGIGSDTATSRKVTTVGINTNSLPINNPEFGRTPTMPGQVNLCLVEIISTSSLNFEIDRISINNNSIDLKLLFEKYLKIKGSYIRFKYVRNDLADLIFNLNDFISNWILTFMFFGTSCLICSLTWMEIKAYLYSDSKLKSHVFKSLNAEKDGKRQDAFDIYTAYWAKLDTRFHYLQALGPATGFILTVSSLVQALHPALGATNDLDAFLNGIHIAMISTFIGLLLRIVALEGVRVNNILLERVDLLFIKL
jgi:hypothetical protein